jgi:hypothetical protein
VTEQREGVEWVGILTSCPEVLRSSDQPIITRMIKTASILCVLLLTSSFSLNQTPPQKIPVMDGGAGPCSLDLTVTDTAAKPVYAATIKVHIAYGFAGIRRLDLEAGTNSEGKVKFTGLPRRVHQAPLEFRASKDDLQAIATVDPSSECQATRTISLAKPTPDQPH